MKNIKTILMLLILMSAGVTFIYAQETTSYNKLNMELNSFFSNYKLNKKDLPQQFHLKNCVVDDALKIITVTTDADFSAQDFTQAKVNKIKRNIRHILHAPYNKYGIKIISNGLAIDEQVSDVSVNDTDMPNTWGDIDYHGKSWVENVSRPNSITHGLANRHISVWASHGRYYDQAKDEWKWQRPSLFCTNEDLFTQTIVLPYLIPMLQNAGAIVYSPRERDWQTNEVIVDNDDDKLLPYYQEINFNKEWKTTDTKGFKYHAGNYSDGGNPFDAGTARMIKSTSRNDKLSKISYQPSIPEEGRYAVYVSYLSLPKSIDDAQYIVYHKGISTEFRVNQQMGGSTWVYLGTFDFDKGCNQYNCVVLTNNSSHSNGIVTADAVRFGGGMGNIQRGGTISGLPRALEGARYFTQWAGAPYSVYSSKNGMEDYGDDINSRSLMTNWLAGGSVYVPTLDGEKVPFELSLAIHSDAGYFIDSTIVGSLAICTTNYNDGQLNSGISRMISKDFADSLLSGIRNDMKGNIGRWNCREIYDRNYSETRTPEIPSAILETMSHQNFADMLYGEDPNFKFLLARSVYKTILRFLSTRHGHPYIVQPLAPKNFSIEFVGGNKVRLNWAATEDTLEPTSHPTSYNVYISTGAEGFDNGHCVKGTSTIISLNKDVQYNFRVCAVNRGGESFPTETLSAYYTPKASKTVLVINGFNRLSSPEVVNTADKEGFDITKDPGVTYGLTAGWIGKQTCFDKSRIGIESVNGLGYSNSDLAGHFIAGNDFNYVETHAESIANTHLYNIVSCSRGAVEQRKINLQKYNCVDLLLGLEKDDGHSLNYYKTFTPKMRTALTNYMKNRGRLFVSGSYVGTDMNKTDDQVFLADILKLQCEGSDSVYADATITGMDTSFDIYKTLNKQHYAATSVDVLRPVSSANSVMNYGDGNSACVAYIGNDYRCVTMGFPFECIISADSRNMVMKKILDILMK